MSVLTISYEADSQLTGRSVVFIHRRNCCSLVHRYVAGVLNFEIKKLLKCHLWSSGLVVNQRECLFVKVNRICGKLVLPSDVSSQKARDWCTCLGKRPFEFST